MSENVTQLRIGPGHPWDWWEANQPAGNCKHCGGQCNGADCGLHEAGCMFGGFGEKFWMIAEGCPLFHGEDPTAESAHVR